MYSLWLYSLWLYSLWMYSLRVWLYLLWLYSLYARSVCRTLHVTGKGGMQAAELAEIFRAAGWRQVDCVSV